MLIAYLAIFVLANVRADDESKVKAELLSPAEVIITADHFDRFGDETDLIYPDGQTRFDCTHWLVTLNNPTEKDEIQLRLDERVIEKGMTDVTIHGVIFHLENARMQYGPYECYWKSVQTKQEQRNQVSMMSGRLCPEQSEHCAKMEKCQETDYCTMTEADSATSGCQKMPANCPQRASMNKLFCPAGVKSICSALSKGDVKVEYRNASCSEKYTHLMYDKVAQQLEAPIMLKKTDPNLIIVVPSGSPAEGKFMRCQLKSDTVTVLKKVEKMQTAEQEIINVDELFKSKPAVYKIQCTFHENETANALVARLANYLVVMGDGIVTAQKSNHQFQCQYNGPVPKYFHLVYFWVKQGWEGKIQDGPILNTTNPPGQYTCIGQFTFKSCSPYRKFVHESKVNVEIEAPITTTTPPPKPSNLTADLVVFDIFNSRVDVYFGNGHTKIVCRTKEDCERNSSDWFHLFMDDKEMARSPCIPETHSGWFLLRHTEYPKIIRTVGFLHGKLECKFKDDTLVISKHMDRVFFCHEHSLECLMDENCTANNFCIHANMDATHAKSSSCSILPSADDVCPRPLSAEFDGDKKQSTATVCPAGTSTVCQAIQKNEYNGSYAIHFGGDGKCPQVIERISYKEMDRLIYEHLYIERDTEFSVNCEKGSIGYEKSLECMLSDQYGKIQSKHGTEKCTDKATFKFDENIFEHGIQILKLKCGFLKTSSKTEILSTMINYLVVLEDTLHTFLSCDDEGTWLNCEILHPLDSGFRVHYYWLEGSHFTMGPKILLDTMSWNKMYYCHAMIVYKTCSPYRRFQNSISISFNMSDLPNVTRTTGPSTTTDDDPTGRTPLHRGLEKIYDRYEDQVDVYYPDGYTMINCSVQCHGDASVELLLMGRAIVREKCDAKWGGAQFKLKNIDIAHTKYQCRYRKEIIDYYFPPVKFCDDLSTECQNETKCSADKYCLITYADDQDPTVESCANLPTHQQRCHHDPKYDPQEFSAVFCPLGAMSFCQALDDHRNTYHESFVEDPDAAKDGCKKGNGTGENIMYDGLSHKFNEVFEVSRRLRTIEIACPKESVGHKAALKCVLKREGGHVIDTHVVDECDYVAKIQLSDQAFEFGPTVHKLICTFNCGQRVVVRLVNHILIMYGSLSIANASNTTDSLECKFAPIPNAHFQMKYWWSKIDQSEQHLQEGKIYDGPEGIATLACHAHITYKTCIGHKTFSRELKAGQGGLIEPTTVSTPPTGTLGNETTGPTPGTGSTKSTKSTAKPPVTTLGPKVTTTSGPKKPPVTTTKRETTSSVDTNIQGKPTGTSNAQSLQSGMPIVALMIGIIGFGII